MRRLLLTSYVYNAQTERVTLSPRAEVVTDHAGIAPTINAIAAFARHAKNTFSPGPTVDTFRQEVRRTNAKVSIELGQGPAMWAAAEMDRNTRVITYFAREQHVLNWSRFTRWVDVLVEFLRLTGEP